MVATASDLREDICHLSATGRRGSPWSHGVFSLVNQSEWQRLLAYTAQYAQLTGPKCEPEDLVCHIGDSPSSGWTTWSARSAALPTIRRCGSLYVNPFFGRHLLLKELFLSMGYPTFSLAHQVSNLPQQFAYQVFVPTLTWWDMRRALGNSMHVAQVGTFVGALLLTSRFKKHDFSLAEIMAIIDSTT